MIAETPPRWQQGGWDTLADATAAFRVVLHETVAGWTRAWGNTPFDYIPVDEKWNEALDWLAAGAPWAGYYLVGYGVAPDGRGNFRFVAIIKKRVDGIEQPHPFSTERALHGDFTPPRQPYDPNKPFTGLTT
jgi:hypothetical protein